MTSGTLRFLVTNLRLGLSQTVLLSFEKRMHSWSTERAWMSPTRLVVVRATNRTVMRLRVLMSADLNGSNGGLHNPSRTTARSQSGNSGLSVAVARLTPSKKGDQGMLSDRLASVSGVTSKDGSQIDHNSRVGEAFAKPALQEPKDLTNRCLGRHQPGDRAEHHLWNNFHLASQRALVEGALAPWMQLTTPGVSPTAARHSL